MTATVSPEQSVLENILLLQNTLQETPDMKQWPAILARGLKALPGIGEVAVCIEGCAATGGGEKSCQSLCNTYFSQNDKTLFPGCPTECPIEGEREWTRFSIRTGNCKHGAFFFDCTEEAFITPYKPFITSTVGLVALHIENNLHKKALEVLNASLNRQVHERTEDLKESMLHYRQLFDLSSDGIVILDPETTHPLEFNRTAHSQLGYTREEFSRLTLGDIEVMKTPEEIRQRILSVLNGKHCEFETQHRTKSGEIRDIYVTAQYLDGIDKPMYHCVWRDITESSAVEARIKMMSSMLDAAPGSITVHNEKGRFLYANQKTFEMHGYEEQEFLSLNLHELDAPESEALIEERLHEVLEKGETCFEVAHRRKDGSTFPLEILSKKVEWQGKPAVLCIASDISERKRLESERLEIERKIQHTQKLESLGVLAGGIAHDFNNLLMAVLGHADLALDEVSPTSAARSNIEQIKTASRRAADLCAQMLAYSGKGRFIIEPFDVTALIEETAHLLRISISKKAVLNLQTEKNLPKVEGDATQIRQVIMNLVMNASEAIGDRDGVIRISTGAAQFSAEDFHDTYFEGTPGEGFYVYIEISDTGCGMDTATLNRLFEPFFTTKFTGRGLGMAAVLGIVKGHKGILKVQSKPGRGTTFRILLQPSSSRVKGDPDGEKPFQFEPAKNRRILLVDDEKSIRTLGKAMLERIGFEAITAADGLEALETYRKERDSIDLVLLDLTMPRMDGEETLRELRRIDPGVKIVMSSGYSDHEIESRFAGEVLFGIIHKPYTLKQLKKCLQPLLL